MSAADASGVPAPRLDGPAPARPGRAAALLGFPGVRAATRLASLRTAVAAVRGIAALVALALVVAPGPALAQQASVPGTVFEVIHDGPGNTTYIIVVPDPTRQTSGVVTCTSWFQRFSSIAIGPGDATTAGAGGCSAPVPISNLPAGIAGTVGTPQTGVQPGGFLTAPVATVPDPFAAGVPAAPQQPVSFQVAPPEGGAGGGVGGAPPGGGSVGRDIEVGRPPVSPPP